MAIGIYIHVPFCRSKCPYCDFYSLTNTDEQTKDAYTAAVERALLRVRERGIDEADTLYFGGGTPSLLGGERMARIMRAAAPLLDGTPEITLEANPADDLAPTLQAFAAAGGNRLSMGMQSYSPAELQFLGRRHDNDQLERAMEAAFDVGIDNISLDMMLGLEGQTTETVAASVDACRRLGASHVSAYLLKVEPNTPFGRQTLSLPDEETTADLYLFACKRLERAGYRQYEISNFAADGKKSRHNLKYWNGDPYIGIGPAAHSFWDGKRLAYPRSLEYFLKDGAPQVESTDETAFVDGSEEEYALLRLRLTEGLTEQGFFDRFQKPIPAAWRERAKALPPHLVTADADGIRFSREGFLLSNALLTRIL